MVLMSLCPCWFQTSIQPYVGKSERISLMPLAIDRLAAVARHLQQYDHPLSAWLGEAVAMVRLGVPLETALDLTQGYAAACRQHAVDAALAALADTAPVATNPTAQAAWIARQAERYGASHWRRDRVAGRPGGTEGHLFDLFTVNAALSTRSIRRRLAKTEVGLANVSAALTSHGTTVS
jgi:hypothetical protein